MKEYNKKRVGMVNKNKYGSNMKIIEYTKANNILVEFQDEHHIIKKTSYDNFIKGSVLNPYDKTVYGTGYLGEIPKEFLFNNSYDNKRYRAWYIMIREAYDSLFKLYKKDVTICKDWLNYSNFIKWYDDNYYEIPIEDDYVVLNYRISLDKHNNEFSPETSMFIPKKISRCISNKSNNKDSNLPVGVSRSHNKVFKYNSFINGNCLGRFKTVDEAFNTYKAAKENTIKDLIKNYKNIVPDKVYNYFYNYNVLPIKDSMLNN